MKKKSNFSVDTRCNPSFNEDRLDATWQQERGPRFGNARKSKSKAKTSLRRKERRKNKLINKLEVNGDNK